MQRGTGLEVMFSVYVTRFSLVSEISGLKTSIAWQLTPSARGNALPGRKVTKNHISAAVSVLGN